jgi:archaellum component FlaD/FlaE
MSLTLAVSLGAPVVAQAYEVGPPSKGLIEGTEKQAQEAAEQQAKENGEKQTKEATEKKQKEEHEHQAAEALQREEAEHRLQAETLSKETEQRVAQQKAEETANLCVVPNLKGDSLSRARAALRKAHCALGKVLMPHHSHGHLVVMGQSVKRGLKRSHGTAVAVTLGVSKSHK